MKDDLLFVKLDVAKADLGIAEKEFYKDRTHAIGTMNDVIADLQDIVKELEK